MFSFGSLSVHFSATGNTAQCTCDQNYTCRGKVWLFPLIHLSPLSFSLYLHIFLFSFSPYQSKTLIRSLVVKNKITPLSPTHSACILLFHSSCHTEERPTKCHGNADGAWFSRVMHLRALSRTIERGKDEWRRKQASAHALFHGSPSFRCPVMQGDRSLDTPPSLPLI